MRARFANAIPALTAAAALGYAASASAQTQPYLGQLMLTAANFCPVGWFPADGRTLPISQYQALFSLMGTSYGGDGVRNFAIPKLAAPKSGLNWCVSYTGTFPTRP